MNEIIEISTLERIVTNLDDLGFVKAALEVQAAKDIIRRMSQEIESNRNESILDAMAVWEHISTDRNISEMIPGEGALEHRSYVAHTFVPFCVKWWEYAHRFLGFDDSFDWEFVPAFTDSLSTYDVEKISPADICSALNNVMGEQRRIGVSYPLA